MATRQPTPAELKEALSLLKQLKKGYTDLGKTTEDVFSTNSDNLKDTIIQAGGVKSILEKWTLELDKVEDSLETAGKSAKSIYQQFNNIVGELKKTNQNITLGSKSMNVFQQTAEKLKNDQQGITRLSKTELETLQKKNTQAISNLNIANQALELQITNQELVGDELIKAQALVDERKEEATAIQDLINLTDARLEKEKEIEKTLGIAPKLLEGLKKIPIIGDVLDIKGAQTAMTEAAEGGASGFKSMGAGVKALGPSLKAALGPLAIISLAVDAVKMLIGAMLDADQQVTDIAHNFNIVKEDAAETRDRFFELSDKSEKFGKIQSGNVILQKDLVKYNMELNAAMGTSIDLSSNLGERGKEIAVQFANASKFLKLGADEQKGLIESTSITGETIDKTKTSILGTVRLRKLESGILLDERKILKDVLTANNAVKLSVKGGSEGLTNAAVAAAKLGSTLNGVAGISKNLLNFEDSISSELEAELLLGKDLNLEKARQYALEGNIEGLANEINKQVGSAADFSKLNVIQQEALAKAMGTSREELADMLVKQESLNDLKGTFAALSDKQLATMKGLGTIDQLTYDRLKGGTASASEYYESLKKAGLTTEELTSKLGDASLQALESQSAQDKFNDTLEKVKESFSRAFTGETIDKFADLLADFIKRWSKDGLFSAIFGSKMSTSEKASTTKQELQEQLKTAPKDQKKELEVKIQEQQQIISDEKYKKQKANFENNPIASFFGLKYKDNIKNPPPTTEQDTLKDKTLKETQTNENPKTLNQQTNDVNAKLDELIAVTKAGGNVYLETDKVGTAHNKSTFKTNK